MKKFTTLKWRFWDKSNLMEDILNECTEMFDKGGWEIISHSHSHLGISIIFKRIKYEEIL